MAEKYPLEQLQLIKKRRLDEAQRILQQKKEALEKEEQKLRELEEERNKTKRHREDKLTQLRADMDSGKGSLEVEGGKRYLKTVDIELQKKERGVRDQVTKVESAKKAVELARQDMLKKQQDVQKLDEHQIEWQKEQKAEEVHKENVLSDELGTAIHNVKKRGKKHG